MDRSPFSRRGWMVGLSAAVFVVGWFVVSLGGKPNGTAIGEALTQKPERPHPQLTLPNDAALGPIIPGLQQGAVPQGLAFYADWNWLLVSLYREDPEDAHVCVLDVRTEQMVRCLTLTNEDGSLLSGHVGGLAIGRGYLWIGNGDVYRVPLAALAEGGAAGVVVAERVFKAECTASFVGMHEDVLWVGEFVHESLLDGTYRANPAHVIREIDGTTVRAWACGYRLDAEGQLTANKTHAGRLIPDVVMGIPEKVQGMAVHDGRLYLSCSYGRANPSTLLAYAYPLKPDARQRDRHVGLGDADVPFWHLKDADRVRWGYDTFPPMSEGIAVYDEKLAVVCESGAAKYLSGGQGPLDRVVYVPLAGQKP
jgi:hypothetical protein